MPGDGRLRRIGVVRGSDDALASHVVRHIGSAENVDGDRNRVSPSIVVVLRHEESGSRHVAVVDGSGGRDVCFERRHFSVHRGRPSFGGRDRWFEGGRLANEKRRPADQDSRRWLERRRRSPQRRRPWSQKRRLRPKGTRSLGRKTPALLRWRSSLEPRTSSLRRKKRNMWGETRFLVRGTRFFARRGGRGDDEEGRASPGVVRGLSNLTKSALREMPWHAVDFENVSTVGLESSPVAAALAGLRANEARYSVGSGSRTCSTRTGCRSTCRARPRRGPVRPTVGASIARSTTRCATTASRMGRPCPRRTAPEAQRSRRA